MVNILDDVMKIKQRIVGGKSSVLWDKIILKEKLYELKFTESWSGPIYQKYFNKKLKADIVLYFVTKAS